MLLCSLYNHFSTHKKFINTPNFDYTCNFEPNTTELQTEFQDIRF